MLFHQFNNNAQNSKVANRQIFHLENTTVMNLTFSHAFFGKRYACGIINNDGSTSIWNFIPNSDAIILCPACAIPLEACHEIK